MAFKTVGNKPQTAMLLDHFKVTPSISSLEAGALFRVRSLSRRINDLEARGHTFRRETRRDSTGQSYTRYWYLGGKR